MFDKKQTEALDILKEDAISNSEIKNEVKQELTIESTDAKNPYLSELTRIM